MTKASPQPSVAGITPSIQRGMSGPLSVELLEVSPLLNRNENTYNNPFSAPKELPNYVVLNVSAVEDPNQSLVTMLHASTYWPTTDHIVPGIQCEEGIMFLYRSMYGYLFTNSWLSTDIYLTTLTTGDPLSSGAPAVNVHMKEKDVVKLIVGTNLNGELYDATEISKTRCSWNNETYRSLWYQRTQDAYYSNYYGYSPDPFSPRGCAKPLHQDPTRISTYLRCPNKQDISVITRSNSTWFSMGVNCSPGANGFYMTEDSGNLQRARCACNVNTLDTIFSTPFQMIRDQEEALNTMADILF